MAFKRDKIDTLAGEFDKELFTEIGTRVLSNQKLTCFIRYLISAERQRGAIGKANPISVAAVDFERWLELHGCNDEAVKSDIISDAFVPAALSLREASPDDWSNI